MGKIKRYLAAISLGVFALSITGCKMIERTPESIRKQVVAKVGDTKITKGEVDDALKYVIDPLKEKYGEDFEKDAQVKEQLSQQRKQMLEMMIEMEVALQKGKELNLLPTDDEIAKQVDERIEGYKTSYGGEEKFLEALKQAGYADLDAFKKEQTKQLTVTAIYKNLNKDVKVSEEEAKKYYDENIKSFTMQPGAEVAHILVKADPKNEEEMKKAETKANQIRDRIMKGEDFAKVAGEVSEDPGSKDNGGSYGYQEYANLKFVEPFNEAVKAGKEGEISKPVKTEFGYHIVKTSNIKTAETVTPFDSIKEKLMTGKVTITGGQEVNLLQNKQNENIEKNLEQWKKDLDVKTYEDKL